MVWTTRVALFLLGYCYHSPNGFFHISWVLISFLIPMRTLLLLSISAYLPVLLWEFILVFGSGIPFIRDGTPFVDYGASYKWKMRAETFEKSLMFSCLLLFFM